MTPYPLLNITKYRLTDGQINLIWEKLGGSIWEIDDILQTMLSYARDGKVDTEELLNELNKIIHANFVKIVDYIGIYYDDELNLAIAKILKEKNAFTIRDLSNFEKGKLIEELGNLVRLNYLYYNPLTGEYKPQGKSFYWAYIKYGEEFGK